jgi:hypothetical protein
LPEREPVKENPEGLLSRTVAAPEVPISNSTIEVMVDWYAVLKNLPHFQRGASQSSISSKAIALQV